MSNNNQYYNPGGNNNYYNPGGNNQYYSPYGNQQYYQNNQYQQDPMQDDEDQRGTKFNPVEWFFTFLHYWYLFVIALAIALGLAMLKNRRWIPTYYSQATIIIKESAGYGAGGGGSFSLMSGFSADPPIVVEYTRIHPRAYGVLYQVSFPNDSMIHVSSMDEGIDVDYDLRYGEELSCPYFDLRIFPTEFMTNSGKIYFRFRDHESLVNEFMSKLQLSFVTEGSTVLALGMTSETPQRDCEFLDMLSKVYLLQNLEQKNAVATNSIKFIKEQLVSLQGSLQVSEGEMTEYRQTNNFIDVNAEASRLMSLRKEYLDQEQALRLRETYFNYLAWYSNSMNCVFNAVN